MKAKTKIEAIRAYTQTLNKVRKYVSGIPGMNITRFYDEAANEKLKNLQNEKNRKGN